MLNRIRPVTFRVIRPGGSLNLFKVDFQKISRIVREFEEKIKVFKKERTKMVAPGDKVLRQRQHILDSIENKLEKNLHHLYLLENYIFKLTQVERMTLKQRAGFTQALDELREDINPKVLLLRNRHLIAAWKLLLETAGLLREGCSAQVAAEKLEKVFGYLMRRGNALLGIGQNLSKKEIFEL